MVIWGARQIGKTYLVKEMFAKKYLKDYVYIDLKKDDKAASYFSSTVDDEKYLSFIESSYGKIISNDCPLIIDEAQTVPNVMTSLKYFNQDHPELPIIVTGSMVRLALLRSDKKDSDSILFPVGKINSLSKAMCLNPISCSKMDKTNFPAFSMNLMSLTNYIRRESLFTIGLENNNTNSNSSWILEETSVRLTLKRRREPLIR